MRGGLSGLCISLCGPCWRGPWRGHLPALAVASPGLCGFHLFGACEGLEPVPFCLSPRTAPTSPSELLGASHGSSVLSGPHPWVRCCACLSLFFAWRLTPLDSHVVPETLSRTDLDPFLCPSVIVPSVLAPTRHSVISLPGLDSWIGQVMSSSSVTPGPAWCLMHCGCSLVSAQFHEPISVTLFWAEGDIDILLDKFHQENQGHISSSFTAASVTKSVSLDVSGAPACTSEW